MKQPSNFYCPGSESQLNRETALSSEVYQGFEGWRGLIYSWSYSNCPTYGGSGYV